MRVKQLLMIKLALALCLSACAVSGPTEPVADQSEALSLPVPDLPLAGKAAPDLMCTPLGASCSTRDGKPVVECCEPSVCVPFACTNSFPPTCFGSCGKPSFPKIPPKQ